MLRAPARISTIVIAAAIALTGCAAAEAEPEIPAISEPAPAPETQEPAETTEAAEQPAAVAGTAEDPVPMLTPYMIGDWEVTWSPIELDQEEAFLALEGSNGSSVPLYTEGHGVIAVDVRFTNTGAPSSFDLSVGISDGTSPIRSLVDHDIDYGTTVVDTGASANLRAYSAVPADVLGAGIFGIVATSADDIRYFQLG